MASIEQYKDCYSMDSNSINRLPTLNNYMFLLLLLLMLKPYKYTMLNLQILPLIKILFRFVSTLLLVLVNSIQH